MEAKEGVLILGVPRSGTTLLRRLIHAHPSFACPPETNVFTACGRFLRSETLADGTRIGVLEGLRYAGIDDGKVTQRLRELAFDLHREYAARQGKRRWAAKTAFDVFYLREIEQLVGDQVAFVCIHRHGLDVASSLQELCDKNGVYLRELHDYIVRYPARLPAFAHAWRDLTNALVDFAERRKGDVYCLKYEDLVEDPNRSMQDLMCFLGEGWDPSYSERALQDRTSVGLGDWKTFRLTEITSSSRGRWRHLPPHTVRCLAEICNSTLERCGYPPVRIETNTSSEDPTRRYQLGLLLQRLKPSNSGQ